MTREQLPCPTEAVEQTALMRWAMYEEGKWPELRLLYHIPNEGKRSRVTGGQMKAQGMRKGVPDLHLPVARGKYHGLYVELKRMNGETPAKEQAEWLEALEAQGYCVCWSPGWMAAACAIRSYLEQGRVIYSPTRGRAGKYRAQEAAL